MQPINEKWNAEISYTTGKLVFYDGSFYTALSNNVNTEPDTSPQSWAVVTSVTSGLTDGATIDGWEYGPAASGVTDDSLIIGVNGYNVGTLARRITIVSSPASISIQPVSGNLPIR